MLERLLETLLEGWERGELWTKKFFQLQLRAEEARLRRASFTVPGVACFQPEKFLISLPLSKKVSPISFNGPVYLIHYPRSHT